MNVGTIGHIDHPYPKPYIWYSGLAYAVAMANLYIDDWDDI